METTINELLAIVKEFSGKIDGIPEHDFSARPLPDKWSKKQVLGHLIDSAQNNIRRFIVGQYDDTPAKIIYEQDFWVDKAGYQQMPQQDVIAFWRLINERIAAVLASMPVKNYSKRVDTGKGEVQLHTLEWLAADYVKHMKHHLNQIIPGSFDVIYK